MKRALAVVLATVLLGICASGALAQVPFIQVYFNLHNDTQSQCLPAGSSTILYVSALNLNMLVSAIDFKVLLPPSLLYTGELPNAGVSDPVLGNAISGEAISYNLPKNGFATLLLTKVFVDWTGQCDCAAGPQPLRVVGYDDIYSPIPQAVSFPDNVSHNVVGMTSLVCPGQVSTEPTTWGGVKALYR